MLATHILAQVEAGRLSRAVNGYTNGVYTIRLTRHTEDAIEGFVKNGDGIEYGVALTAQRAFCSCKDAMFRHTVCKHATVLALHVIRTPHDAQPVQPERYQLRDRVNLIGHPNVTGKVVCVSGDTVSVAWDRGGIRPLSVSQIERCEEATESEGRLRLGKTRKGFSFSA